MLVCLQVVWCEDGEDTIKKMKKCPLPGLNQRPLDLQSNALPAELKGPAEKFI